MFQENKARQIFRKTNISYPLIRTRTCQEVRDLPKIHIKPFHPSATFDIETSHLICSVNQMTGFYVESNAGLIFQANLRKFSQKGTRLIYRTSEQQ